MSGDKIEELVELNLRVYDELANASQIIKQRSKDVAISWNESAVADRADPIIQELLAARDDNALEVDTLRASLAELHRELSAAHEALVSYSQYLDGKPGRGGMKGIFVRSCLNRIRRINDDYESLE